MSISRGWFRRLLPWLLVVGVVGIAVRRLRFSPTPVASHTLSTGEIRGEVMGTGTLEARLKTTISPRIQERLVEVLVDQGDPVKADQLLARLDDAETRQQVAVAEANLAAARATVDRVRADLARAEAVLEQAQLNHRRSVELLAGKIAAQADFDRSAEALRIAEADLARTRSAILEAERQAVASEKNLLFQRGRLLFTEMRSPWDGLVTRRDRDPGDVVVPGASILHVVATNEIWVSAWVDETAMSGLKVGQPVRVVFRSEPTVQRVGEVVRLGRETDRETREFLVDVSLKQLPANWTMGQRAEVFIENGHRTQAVVMPARFVQWRAGQSGVWMDDGGRASWRNVTLGLVGADAVEIVEGLAPGDRVVRTMAGRAQPLIEGQRIVAP